MVGDESGTLVGPNHGGLEGRGEVHFCGDIGGEGGKGGREAEATTAVGQGKTRP